MRNISKIGTSKLGFFLWKSDEDFQVSGKADNSIINLKNLKPWI